MKEKNNPLFIVKEQGQTVHMASNYIEALMVWTGMDKFLDFLKELWNSLLAFIEDFPFIIKDVQEFFKRLELFFQRVSAL